MLDELLDKFKSKLSKLSTSAEILNLKAEYLGKKGQISKILQSLKDAGAEERQRTGSRANALKKKILSFSETKLQELDIKATNQKLIKDKIDISLRESSLWGGVKHAGLHPISIIQQEIEDIFLSMGFSIIDGPHIEDEYHNFSALNIPADHPARDMQDTFWFEGPDQKAQWLLRTHTSTIQIRGMKENTPPFKFIAPGKVFRCERTDASHESVFHQVEGMMVDRDVSVAHLIYIMKTLLSEIFQKKMEIRLRPGFFPFVEPGFELDIKCIICKGKGCSVCKNTGWVELLPCGMIHPNVLSMGGVDPKEWNGFAFGLGLDRLVMMRYEVDDIRHIHGADLRFISQFQTY